MVFVPFSVWVTTQTHKQCLGLGLDAWGKDHNSRSQRALQADLSYSSIQAFLSATLIYPLWFCANNIACLQQFGRMGDDLKRSIQGPFFFLLSNFSQVSNKKDIHSLRGAQIKSVQTCTLSYYSLWWDRCTKLFLYSCTADFEAFHLFALNQK